MSPSLPATTMLIYGCTNFVQHAFIPTAISKVSVALWVAVQSVKRTADSGEIVNIDRKIKVRSAIPNTAISAWSSRYHITCWLFCLRQPRNIQRKLQCLLEIEITRKIWERTCTRDLA